jgi:hypothetical protein
MYLDPGTGSILFQALLAALLGVGLITRVFWKRIKSLFGKKEVEKTTEEDKE